MTTATIEEITASVIEIVADVLGRDAADLAPDTDLRTVEGADSIRVLRIVARIEQRYDIELDDADVFAVSTVDQVATVVSAAVGT
jgi:acyl carrier protein